MAPRPSESVLPTWDRPLSVLLPVGAFIATPLPLERVGLLTPMVSLVGSVAYIAAIAAFAIVGPYRALALDHRLAPE